MVNLEGACREWRFRRHDGIPCHETHGPLAFVKVAYGEKQMADLREKAQKPLCDVPLELINQKPDRAIAAHYVVEEPAFFSPMQLFADFSNSVHQLLTAVI